jgi:hypothetical protein
MGWNLQPGVTDADIDRAAPGYYDEPEEREEERKIIVSHVFPPIPLRNYDYCAFFEGDEESLQYGYGATEEEAIANLLAAFDEGFYE